MLKFALKNLRTRLARAVLASIAVILCTTIALVSYNTANQMEDGVISTAGYYDTIVGPEGSPLQLAMSSMFYVENPLGTISYEYYEKLKDNPSVTEIYPFAAGDSYRSVPIIGTVPEYLDKYELDSGRMFSEREEAVLGYEVARTGVLEIGDKFAGVHGFADHGHVHDDFEYEVVGVLSRTNTASDNVIFTTTESIWIIHDHGDSDCDEDDHDDDQGYEDDHHHEDLQHDEHDHDHNGHTHKNGHEHHDDEDEHEHHNDHEHDDHEDEHAHGHDHYDHDHDHKITGDLVSLIIRTDSLAAHQEIKSDFDGIAGVQAINPATVLRDLLDNLSMGRDILYILAAIIMFMTAVIIYVTTASFVEDSKKDILIMRLVGIKRKTIFSLFLIQVAFISLVSIVVSFIISMGALFFINQFTAETFGILIDATKHYPGEIVLLLGVFAIVIISAVISIIPAYRHDPLEVK